MGEIIQNIHTFVLPQNHTYTLQMNFAYDSWNRPSAPLRNRVLNITYPDSEVVHYQYDAAGQLQSMYGIKDQQTVPIIDFIGYDAMGSRSRIEYGNGTFTDYTYDGYRQRLSQLKTQNSSAAFMDLHYSYDKENNITGIENIAAAVNGLGGVYENEYTYDDMYRLTNANGTFTDKNSTNFPFILEMSYTASGNIATKAVTADILAADNTVSQVAYDGNYAYNQGQTHTISTISGTGIDMSFQWDLNGNMKVHSDNLNSLNRYLCWDEENRLMAVKDNNYLSAYVYDAAGERVWKLSGEVTQMKISGVGTIDVASLSNKTLYVSPYVVYNQQGYSKHYYAGAERVSSRIGGGTMYGLQDPITDTVTPITDEYSELSTHLWEMLERSFSACLDLYTEYIGYEPHLESVQESASQNNTENNWYIYHSDHLGSSSFLTDANGDPTQHLQYLPFGENFIEQRVTTDYYTPYTFSAKERDPETGYSYFGARYYDPNVSVWLSVDPLSDKYPSMSAFMYCAGNPVVLVDPDGRYFVGIFGQKVHVRQTKNGAIKVGIFAGRDLRRMARWINNSGSNTAKSDFLATAENPTKVHFKITNKEISNNLLGLHQAHDADGKRLEWDSQQSKFKGNPAYITDNSGKLYYKEATITIFSGNTGKSLQSIKNDYSDQLLTRKEACVSIMTHEEDHNNNQHTIHSIKASQEGQKKINLWYDVERTAYDKNIKVFDEIKNAR